MMIAKTLLALFLLAATAQAYAAEQKLGGPVLGDLLKLDTHRAAWNQMLAGEKVPDWVHYYERTLEGPATPSFPLAIGEDFYTLAFTCKAHACGDNQLYVLFAPEGKQAWALLTIGGKHKWIGHPFPYIKRAILSGLEAPQ